MSIPTTECDKSVQTCGCNNCLLEINLTKFCAYDLFRSYAWMNDLSECPSPSLCHPDLAAVFVPAVNLLIDDSSLIA